jgi:RNA polymerase sigma-70 factor, ECF subfamily
VALHAAGKTGTGPRASLIGMEQSRREEGGREDTTRLVTSAKEGNEAAFRELHRRYHPRIKALSIHMLGNAEDAEDVTQEAFLRAHRALPRFEGRAEFFTWLYRIAVRLCLNRRRDRRRRAHVPLDDPRLRVAVEVDSLGDPRRALELTESYARLLEAFDALSPTLRSTVVLVTLQGLTHPEAAKVLGTREGTIAWRIFEARRQLTAHLERAEGRAITASARARAEQLRRMTKGEHPFDRILAHLTPETS